MKEYVFYCDGCGKEVTRGFSSHSAEHISNCPHCGARFGNTAAGNAAERMDDARDRMDQMTGRNGWNNRNGGGPAGAGTPNMQTPPAAAGGNPNQFAPGPAAANNGQPTAFPPPSNTTPATTTATSGASRGATILLVVFVGGGLLLLLVIAGIGGVIWMISTAPSSAGSDRPVKRRRRDRGYEPI